MRACSLPPPRLFTSRRARRDSYGETPSQILQAIIAVIEAFPRRSIYLLAFDRPDLQQPPLPRAFSHVDY